jgi:8-amino-7-oxononanoate synthase
VRDRFLNRVQAKIEDARARLLLRELDCRQSMQAAETTINHQKVVNFTSNDYLGLASDPSVIDRVSRELPVYGFGSGSAALLSGRSSLHEELEVRLAAFVGAESALLFSSGYMANLGAIQALTSAKDMIFHDKLNHASLIDAVIASGAKHKRYPHCSIPKIPDMNENTDGVPFLLSESVFSMDGDVADLDVLSKTVSSVNGVFYIDDAHGFGVIGQGKGAGGIIDYRAESSITIGMIAFGKSLGSLGAAIVAPKEVIALLVQKARTFIYDTALPPVCCAAALAALDVIAKKAALRNKLNTNIEYFRSLAKTSNVPVMHSDTPIQPILVGDELVALQVAEQLLVDGFYVKAIRFPTVPKGTARIRVTLTAAHSRQHIYLLCEKLKAVFAR